MTFVSVVAAVKSQQPASFLILSLAGTCYAAGDGESSVFIIFIVDAVGESRSSVKCAALKIDDNEKTDTAQVFGDSEVGQRKTIRWITVCDGDAA